MRAADRMSRQRAMARASMFIQADLGWMEGAPVRLEPGPDGLEWLVLSAGRVERLQVDRARVIRATRSLNRLVNKFPGALPHLVGDVEAWAEPRRRLLQIVKAALHEGARLPEHRFSDAPTSTHAARLLAEHHRLAGAVRVCSWASLGEAPRLRKALGWLEAHAETFDAMQDARVAAVPRRGPHQARDRRRVSFSAQPTSDPARLLSLSRVPG